MKREPLCFESVRLDRMPGFPPNLPFTVEGLDRSVHVVTGPNMSGKTTLANAIAAVLWPRAADKRAEVSAKFRLAGSSWSVRVEEKTLQSCQRDGRSDELMDLPSEEVRHRYHISLVDLLQDPKGADQFAARIARETAGGYDLDKASSAIGASSDAGAHRKEARDLDEARRKVREVRSGQEDLARREDKLAEMEEQREEARRATSDAGRLEAALELWKASDEEREAASAYGTYPATMAGLTGKEAQTLEELKAKIGREQEGLRRCLQQGHMAAEEIAAVGLPAGGIANERLRAMRKRLEMLEGLEARVLDKTVQKASAAEAAEEVLREMGSCREAVRPNLDIDALLALEKLAETSERLAGKKAVLERLRLTLEAALTDSGDDVRRLAQGRTDLVAWFKSSGEAGA
ncbi:MAG: hypothetical protein FJ109_21950, partial [Deltaproteobacteria bacterium]|nr:hypothetical protein [Deltaproteobacteria bacterium]